MCTYSFSGDPPIIGYPCDVTDEQAVEKAFSHVQDHLGPVSVLVNTAGITKDGLLIKSKKTDIHDVLSTNLIGSMLTCKHALRQMIQKKHGTIINVGKKTKVWMVKNVKVFEFILENKLAACECQELKTRYFQENMHICFQFSRLKCTCMSFELLNKLLLVHVLV